MNKTLPFAILGICAFVIVGSFLLPFPNNNQQAAIASAQTSSSFIITNQTLQTREGSTASVKIKATAPVQKTTRVCANVTPDRGTTSRDYVRPRNTCITFYKGGVSEKSLSVRTVRTATEADKSLTVKITSVRVGTASTQRVTASAAQTAKVLIADQKNTGTTPPVANNNQNTNTTPTTPPVATTPPTDCAQYAGVIPGETRKVRLQRESFSRAVMPGVDQAGLDKISYDLSGPKVFGTSQETALGRRRSYEPGVAYVYKFTTSDYNMQTVFQDLTTSTHPASNGGRMLISVSECPADFTSPAVLAQQAGNDAYGTTVGYGGRDGKVPMCVGSLTGLGGSILFGIGSGEYTCQLEKNKTYYLNFTAGFVKSATEGGASGGPYTASLADGNYNGEGGSIHSFDVESKVRPDELGGGFGYRTSTGGASRPPVTLIKGLESTYQSIYSIMSTWNTTAYNNMQQAIATQRACIAALPANTPYPRPANLCNIPNNVAPPTPSSWQKGSFR